MKTFCTHKGEKHEVTGFHINSDEYMSEHHELHKYCIDTKDSKGGLVRVPLVMCKDITQVGWLNYDDDTVYSADTHTPKNMLDVLEELRSAIQAAEEFGLLRTESGDVITGAVRSDDGFVLTED